MQIVAELEEGVGHRGVPDLPETPVLPQPPGHGAEDRVAHLSEVEEGLVAILAGTEVHLSHGVETNLLEDVYHDPRLHRVTCEERYGREELLVGDELARQGLHETGELGVEEVEERLGGQLRNSSPSVLLDRIIALERPPEGPLDEAHPRYAEYGPQGAVYELGFEVLRVRVGEHHEVSSRHREAPPHGVAFAVRPAVFAE